MTKRTSYRQLFTVVWVAIGGVVLAASPAGAHTGGGAAGFRGGLEHPIGGHDHLLAMVAVGILAVVGARLDRRFLWAAPVTFVAAMVLGGAAGFAGIVSEPFELVVVGSVAVLGVAIVGASRADAERGGAVALGIAVVLLTVAGLAHGHAHGVEAAGGTNVVAYVGGFVAATVGLHAAGAAVAALVRARPSLATSLGVGVAAVGVGLLV